MTGSSARAPTALEITGEPDLENANIRARRAKGPIPPQHSLSRANATSRACQSNKPRRTLRKMRQTPTKTRCRRAAKESKHRQPIRTTPKRAPPRISPSDTKSPYSADTSIHLRRIKPNGVLREPVSDIGGSPCAHLRKASQHGRVEPLTRRHVTTVACSASSHQIADGTVVPFAVAVLLCRSCCSSRAAAVCPKHPKDAVNLVRVCRRAFLPFAFRICFGTRSFELPSPISR